MSNVIRHKRGTSNPAAGDFSNTGELLVNTSDGGVFTKTDGNSVVEIGSNASNLSTGTVPSGRLSGSYGISVTGSSASCTGNAASATVLQTARTIGGVSFNGSANINLPGVNTAGNQNTSGSSASCTGNAASATVLQTARTIGGVSFNGSANINLPGVNTTGNQNTSGSSASCTGNAATATTLQTARTIQGVSFNGSANITVVTAGTGISVSGTAVTNTGVTSLNGSTGALTNFAKTNSTQTYTAPQRGGTTALTSSSSITPNFGSRNNFTLTLATNTTINNPSNLTAGQSGVIVLTYSGNRTVAFGSYWKFPGGTAPTMTSTSGKVDVIVYYVESSTRISAQVLLNMGG